MMRLGVILTLLPILSAQICNSLDPNARGLILLPFGTGGSLPTINGTQVPFSACTPNLETGGYHDCVVPEFDPQPAMAVAYLAILLYLFLAVALVSDSFMAAIEVVANRTRIVQVRDVGSGELHQAEVVMWNATVSNLTLMALGTSAPEILMSAIEVFSNSFFAGDLGPGTVLGSASYNLLCITAICMVAVPKANNATGETGTRKIADINVFLVTTIFSVGAYAWLLFILQYSSPDAIELWEASVTFALYPVLVVAAWATDRRLCCRKQAAGEEEPQLDTYTRLHFTKNEVAQLLSGEKVRDMTVDEATQLAALHHFQDSKKSAAFYRIAAVREYLAGGRSVLTNLTAPEEALEHDADDDDEQARMQPQASAVGFVSDSYSAFEGEGEVTLQVRRTGNVSEPLAVDYNLMGDTARSGIDFLSHTQSISKVYRPGMSPHRRKHNNDDHSDFNPEWTDSDSEDEQAESVVTIHTNGGRGRTRERGAGARPTTRQREEDYDMDKDDVEDDEAEAERSATNIQTQSQGQPGGQGGQAAERGWARGFVDEMLMFVMVNAAVLIAGSAQPTAPSQALTGMLGSSVLALGYRQKDKIGNALGLNIGNGNAKSKRRVKQDDITVEGRLVFAPGERIKTISVSLMDDDLVEKDEKFRVVLSNPQPRATKMSLATAEVTVKDDDAGWDPGIIEMATTKSGRAHYYVQESAESVVIKLERHDGCLGECSVSYKTRDGTAIGDRDFVIAEDTVQFQHGQRSAVIEIQIIDDQRFEKNENFSVILYNPQGCRLGPVIRAKVTVIDDDYMTQLTESIAKRLNLNLDRWNVYSSSWKHQLREAMQSPPRGSGCLKWLMHLLTLPLKLVLALLPPAKLLGGWLAYCAAFCVIGLLTAFVADVASLLGCALGLQTAITAITFVAIGTSLPDTFSAKIVAINDKTADNSIGKVTGSNSVNVFLGLGLPWFIAAIYWEKGVGATPAWLKRAPAHVIERFPNGVFVVEAGSLSFSIGLFFGCCVLCITMLMLRRKFVGAELGGGWRIPSTIFPLLLWVVYLTLSILQISGAIVV